LKQAFHYLEYKTIKVLRFLIIVGVRSKPLLESLS